MKKIKESKYKEKTRIHESIKIPDDLISFSFRYLSFCNKFPLKYNNTYIDALFDRLKAVSDIKVTDFINNRSKGLRSHSHDWCRTSEPKGYSHLNEHLRQCKPWQFSLSRHEHGRIHGMLIDDVFYIVWLDPDHNLYS